MSNTSGGLSLSGRIDGVGEAEAGRIHQDWNMSDAVDRFLTEHLGMAPAREPQHPCPELNVEDLTTADNNEYTRLFTVRTAWFGFLSEKLAEVKAKLIEIKAERVMIETSIRTSMRKSSTRTSTKGVPKGPPAAEIDDAINVDTRYMELTRLLVFHSEVLERLDSRVQHIDRVLRLTSRQVEIRRQENEGLGRSPQPGGPPRPGMRVPTRRFGGE